MLTKSVTPEVYQAKTLAEICRTASEFICEMAVNEVRQKKIFTLGLAGGKTPSLLYEYLANPPIVTRMPWKKILLFWGDERWVPPDHPDSNYAMAFRSLLSKIDIPSANIHRIPTNSSLPKNGALDYEKILHNILHHNSKIRDALKSSSEAISRFDMILLGMGKDGHTASLFPNSKALNITRDWVTAVEESAVSPAVPRITLTLPFINEARSVLFLISGRKKLEISKTILTDPERASRLYPAARVRPQERLLWFIAEH